MKTMIDEMVTRFLGWKLPANFAPDAGMKFVPGPLQQPGGPYWPSGTNLLDATQARQMFEHCMPDLAQPAVQEGFALVPKQLTKAMSALLSEEGWEWADLLAAAEAITEEEYEGLLDHEQAEPVNSQLLEALRLVLSEFCRDGHGGEFEDGERPYVDMARAAISAAEAQQTPIAADDGFNDRPCGD